jgi:hypothetical protein
MFRTQLFLSFKKLNFESFDLFPRHLGTCIPEKQALRRLRRSDPFTLDVSTSHRYTGVHNPFTHCTGFRSERVTSKHLLQIVLSYMEQIMSYL